MSKAEPYTTEHIALISMKLLSIRERELLATIDERDRRIAELTRQLEEARRVYGEMSEALDAVRIALEFYANPGNWIGETLTGLPDSMLRSDGGGIAQDALDRLAKGAANVCDADSAAEVGVKEKR